MARTREVRGLLLTVGGTSDPLVATLQKVRPRHVALVCSEETLATATETKRVLAQLLPENERPSCRTFSVDDPADLIQCYTCVRKALQYLGEQCGLPVEAVRIDYTGGTKTMSAAAVLAAAPDGHQFVYVTGERRNKGGVGTVVSGHEKLVFPQNPWVVLEEPAVRSLLGYAQLGQWAAAIETAQALRDRAAQKAKPVFGRLISVLEGLSLWDEFDHGSAIRHWGQGEVPGRLVEIAEVSEKALICGFARKCLRMVPWLQGIVKFEDSPPPRRKPDPLVLDILANAERQALRGHRDEAALRYYRAVELCAQRRLKHLHGLDSDRVPEADVPEPLRSDLKATRGAPQRGVWKLGLHDTAILLGLKGDAIGSSIVEALPKLDIAARNQSWLIHGLGHVTERQLAGFRKAVLAALSIDERDIRAWPDFRPERT